MTMSDKENPVPLHTIHKFLVVFVLGVGALLVLGYMTHVIQLQDVTSRAAPGSEFKNRATVYVFRNDSHAGDNGPLDVSLDGSEAGAIRRKTYLDFPVSGGKHRITVRCSRCGVPTITFEASYVTGETYYFLIEPFAMDGYGTQGVGSKMSQLRAGSAHLLLRTYERGIAADKQGQGGQG